VLRVVRQRNAGARAQPLTGRTGAHPLRAMLADATAVPAAPAIVRIVFQVHAPVPAAVLVVGADTPIPTAFAPGWPADLAVRAASAMTSDPVIWTAAGQGGPCVGRRHRHRAEERAAAQLERLPARDPLAGQAAGEDIKLAIGRAHGQFSTGLRGRSRNCSGSGC
jgi:hypothetical protein